MSEEVAVVIGGDSLVHTQVSNCEHPQFRTVVDAFRSADVGLLHCEMTLHDFDGPGTFPSADGGEHHSDPVVAKELRAIGIDMVSLAHNHALDYSYGGLVSSWRALEAAGIRHAGTGRNLAEARAPTYLDTPKARVALVSMCSTFPQWARAGAQRLDMRGRPGLNPLGYHHVVGADTAATIRNLAVQLGWWVTDVDDGLLVHPSGLHRSMQHYVVGDVELPLPVVDELDAAGNLAAIAEARARADLVIVHLHSHEWDTRSNSLLDPPDFVRRFARDAVDAGADVFVAQGAHAPVRGVELHQGRPIFYDPGDLFMGGPPAPSFGADFYLRPDYPPETRDPDASPLTAIRALGQAVRRASNPPAGFSWSPGAILPRCRFVWREGRLTLGAVELLPIKPNWGSPWKDAGVPFAQDGESAQAILGLVQELSAAFGTSVRIDGDVGIIDAPAPRETV